MDETRPQTPAYSSKMDAYKKKQKKRLAEKKKNARKEALSRIPLANRDPSGFLIEIEKLRDLECEGKLDGPGRMKRQRLEQQFTALNKARVKAKLLTLELPKFDPEEYLERKRESKSSEIIVKEKKEEPINILTGIPMPDDNPLEDGVPGLPSYKLTIKKTLSPIVISKPLPSVLESNNNYQSNIAPVNIDDQVEEFLASVERM